MPATAEMASARAAMTGALRDGLSALGYLEVETPIAVPFGGQEPHLRPFETVFTPDPPIPPGGVHDRKKLHLHTSPEYAMKRLLARPGFSRCYQFARVFRDGEVSRTHNPEFTLLEFYASPGSADSIMADLENLIAKLARSAPARKGHGRGTDEISLAPPFERIACREAFARWAGFDPLPLDADAFAQAARAVGVRPAQNASWDEVFTQVLLEKIEPCLGIEKPTYLTEYPASQAALARLKPGDPRVAERFELYAGGLELANGFAELCDSHEQRKRLQDEQRQRAALGRDVFPLDEEFLHALDQIGEAGGVALGVDRLLMLLTGAQSIAEVLLFPAADEYPRARS
ncbi:MAG: EF-P lysine aminoacylase GenX [Deltaproteobacteria bacterium]|nr:MAG: EF-P lysine aminoacylase GenX [Deltaproteobacteria bacterium]